MEFYNEIYSQKPGKWNIQWRDEFAYEVIRHTSPKSILDIGCGNGHTLAYLHERIPDIEYYGIDFSEKAIEIAGHYAPFAELSCVSFENSTVTADVVIIMGVLEHLYDLDTALQKLKNTGRLIYVECPNCLHYSNIKTEGYRKTNNACGQKEWHLTRDTWEGLILEAGFDIIEAIVGKSKTTEFVWVLQ